jgi:hypothetical protein
MLNKFWYFIWPDALLLAYMGSPHPNSWQVHLTLDPMRPSNHPIKVLWPKPPYVDPLKICFVQRSSWPTIESSSAIVFSSSCSLAYGIHLMLLKYRPMYHLMVFLNIASIQRTNGSDTSLGTIRLFDGVKCFFAFLLWTGHLDVFLLLNRQIISGFSLSFGCFNT